MTDQGQTSRKVLPRDRGGSMTLTEGTGPIMAMCPCGEFLEIFKEDITVRVQTPDSIDPERSNPDAPTVAMVSERIGCANPIIARVLLQGRQILDRALFPVPVDTDGVTQVLHTVKEALIAAYKASEAVRHATTDIIERVQREGIQVDSRQRIIQSLPQVPDLDSGTAGFLIAAKRAIRAICTLVPYFVEVDGTDTNFDRLGLRLERLIGKDAPLTEFVNDYAGISRYIIELRNLQEHPSNSKRTHVDNFRVRPDGNVATPMWYLTGEEPQPIHVEMPLLIDRMVEMTEGLLIHLVMLRIGDQLPLVIRELDTSEIDAKCPIRYELTLYVRDMVFESASDGVPKTPGDSGDGAT